MHWDAFHRVKISQLDKYERVLRKIDFSRFHTEYYFNFHCDDIHERFSKTRTFLNWFELWWDFSLTFSSCCSLLIWNPTELRLEIIFFHSLSLSFLRWDFKFDEFSSLKQWLQWEFIWIWPKQWFSCCS